MTLKRVPKIVEQTNVSTVNAGLPQSHTSQHLYYVKDNFNFMTLKIELAPKRLIHANDKRGQGMNHDTQSM